METIYHIIFFAYMIGVCRVAFWYAKKGKGNEPKRQPLPDIVEEKLSWYWDESILN